MIQAEFGCPGRLAFRKLDEVISEPVTEERSYPAQKAGSPTARHPAWAMERYSSVVRHTM